MSLIVRKIEKGKWMQNDILSGADVSADAITNCMKTKNNTLSVWEVSREDQVDDVVLALASQSQQIETMDVVVLDRSTLISSGLHLQETDSPTPVRELSKIHRDIVQLTYTSLGVLARIIVDAIRNKTNRRYTRGKIRNLMDNAIAAGRLNKEALKENVKSHLC
jgi:hypothetical protein